MEKVLTKKELIAEHNAAFVPIPFDHTTRRSLHPGIKGRVAPKQKKQPTYTMASPNPRTEARHAKLRVWKKRMAIHRARFNS